VVPVRELNSPTTISFAVPPPPPAHPARSVRTDAAVQSRSFMQEVLS
jgi:hypothetical protein